MGKRIAAPTAETIANLLKSLPKPHKKRIVKINLTDCFADPEYQREYDERHVMRMFPEFSWDYIRRPMVSLRGRSRKYAIINGQHTIGLLLLLGITVYECEVYYGLTVEEEAAIFHATNCRQKEMKGWANFKAAKRAGFVVENRIFSIVQSFGLKLALEGSPHADFTTPQTLRAIYKKRGGEPLFTRMIDCLKTCFIQGRADQHLREDAKRNEFQKGLAQFLRIMPNLTAKQLKTFMDEGGWNAESIYVEAVTRAGSCRRTRSIEKYLVEIFKEIVSPPKPPIRMRAKLKRSA